MCKVDENKHIIFRLSVLKMKVAAKMSLSTHFFRENFTILMENLIEQGTLQL